ncbi:MAG: TonB-dependent receptor, partial [Ignavibacteriaceae bacterium]|nr:TonB-dependent receptor [Ignavibacteriaceae bacterium]
MKNLIVLFVILNFSTFSQQLTIIGNVVDDQSNAPLVKANVRISTQTGIGTFTDNNGKFGLTDIITLRDTLTISYVGYKTGIYSIEKLLKMSSVKILRDSILYTFRLSEEIIASQTVFVEATIFKKGTTPLAFDQIKRKEIEKTYTVYDIPKYLSELPSTTFFSESGSGIGYNYLSIRGFDQRRISVSINGIP